MQPSADKRGIAHDSTMPQPEESEGQGIFALSLSNGQEDHSIRYHTVRALSDVRLSVSNSFTSLLLDGVASLLFLGLEQG
jgi:hypothetical protein